MVTMVLSFRVTSTCGWTCFLPMFQLRPLSTSSPVCLYSQCHDTVTEESSRAVDVNILCCLMKVRAARDHLEH